MTIKTAKIITVNYLELNSNYIKKIIEDNIRGGSREVV